MPSLSRSRTESRFTPAGRERDASRRAGRVARYARAPFDALRRRPHERADLPSFSLRPARERRREMFRAEVVGSMLRPTYLARARAELQAGTLSTAEFKRVEDRAVDQVIAAQ